MTQMNSEPASERRPKQLAPPSPLPAFCGYGIEVEYMIVDRRSLAVQPLAAQLLSRGAGHEKADAVRRDAFGWSNELMCHLIEIKNLGPTADFDMLTAGLRSQVNEVNSLLAEFSARLMPGAMHPWMDPATEGRLWDGDNADLYRTYQRIFDCRTHGWANLQSMQLNLPFADDGQLARLHSAVRLLLPILPALAASSPVADGRSRREMDYRMTCYLEHSSRVPSLVGQLIPEPLTSRAEYLRDVQEPMYRDMAPLDPEGLLRHEWLDCRGAVPRFDRNAIEIRVIDTQECPEADVAVAAFVAAVARALYEDRWSSPEERRALDSASLRHLLLDCLRDGERTPIGHSEYLRQLGYSGRHCLAQDLWHQLYEACGDDPLLSESRKTWIADILDRGPLARRLRNAMGTRPSRKALHRIYGHLADCLAVGQPFTGEPP